MMPFFFFYLPCLTIECCLLSRLARLLACCLWLKWRPALRLSVVSYLGSFGCLLAVSGWNGRPALRLSVVSYLGSFGCLLAVSGWKMTCLAVECCLLSRLARLFACCLWLRITVTVGNKYFSDRPFQFQSLPYSRGTHLQTRVQGR